MKIKKNLRGASPSNGFLGFKSLKLLSFLVATTLVAGGFFVAFSGVRAGETSTLAVSQPVQLTSSNYYERGQSVVYDGSNYWLFFTRSLSVTDSYDGADPDTRDYEMYYKKASTVAALAGADAVKVAGDNNANLYLGETDAAIFNGQVWVFAAHDPDGLSSGSSISLYAWVSGDGGQNWEEKEIATTMPDGSAHFAVGTWNNELWVSYKIGGTWQSKFSTDGSIWSDEYEIQASSGTAKLYSDDSGLYFVRAQGGAQNISQWSPESSSWSVIDTATDVGAYDPSLLKVGANYVYLQAPWSSPKQWIEAKVSSSLSNVLSAGSKISVTAANYGDNTWIDMWPVGFTDNSGNGYIFYTSERNSADPSVDSSGNIWYLELNWDLSQNHYTYISNAVGAASADDTIAVAAGTYKENIVVDKALTLQGADKETTIIDGGASGSVVKITASNVSVSGLTIQNSGNDLNADAGLLVYMANNATITNNIIKDNNSLGLALQVSSGATITNNQLNNNYLAGIALVGSSNNTIANNTSTGNLNVEGEDYGYGIVLDEISLTYFSTGNTITSNTFSNNESNGIYFGERCDGNTITDNTIESNEGDAIYFWKSGTNTVTGNTINSNPTGLQLMASQDNTISDNAITNNDLALLVRSGNINYGSGWQELKSTGNSISDNNMSANDSGVTNEDSSIVVNIENNYWGETLPSFSDYLDYSPWCTNEACTEFGPVMLVQESSNTGYSSINEAIAAASAGDSIQVITGTYAENIVIDKSISISGPAGAVIQVASGKAVSISADDVVFDGFSINHTSIATLNDVGIYVDNSENVIIKNSAIGNNAIGIEMLDSGHGLIDNNTINANVIGLYFEGTTDGLGNFDGGGNGPFYSLSVSNTVSNNTISNSIKYGSDYGFGIYLDAACEDNTFSGNTIQDNAGDGFYSWKADSSIITENTIDSNGGMGIQLMGSSDNRITNNSSIDGNQVGILLRSGALSSTSNVISGNSITNSVITGLEFRDDVDTNNYDGFVSGNSVYNNKIYSNVASVITTSVPAETVFGLENNYWGESLPSFPSQVDYNPWYIDVALTTLVSDNVALDSTVYSVGEDSISGITFAETKANFLANLSKGHEGQSWDSSDIHDPVVTGDSLLVTAQDGFATATYTITTNPEPELISVTTLEGVVAPATGAIPVTTISENEEYTGTVGWSPDNSSFGPARTYTATITINTKDGYRIAGISENFFDLEGADSVANSAESNIVTVVFPATEKTQLTITSPSLTTSKIYDGTNSAAVTEGELVGIFPGDEVTVSAEASYEDAEIGTGKTITVVYSLGGADASRYIKPVDYSASGVINPVPSSAKEITSFKFSVGSVGVITEDAVAVNVPSGTDARSLTPSILINGSSIDPASGSTQDFSSPVEYTVSAEDGSTQVYTVTVTVLEEEQTAPNDEGEATISDEVPEVIIESPTQEVLVTVSSGTTNPKVNVSSLVSAGTGTMPKITMNTALANTVIPAATVITSASSTWDGIIKAPTVTTVEIPQTSGSTKTLGVAIELGSSDTKLSFDKGVRIIMPDQAGKDVGYIRPGESFQDITAVCGEDSQAWADANLATDDECKIDVGDDLVVWTKHFTKFATYSTATTSSGGGGGGFYNNNCSSVSYGSWGECIDGFQYREIYTKVPSACVLSTAQQLAKRQTCVMTEKKVSEEQIPSQELETEKQVLGEKQYAEGTLIRTLSDYKVYVILSGVRHHIANLVELQKYAGQEILDINDIAKTAEVQKEVKGEKRYGNGSLIRVKGQNKVYLIMDGLRKHIRSLAELHKYVGQEIIEVDVDDPILGSEIISAGLADGSLVRGENKKIYVITQGKLKHVRSLEELRQQYFGQFIYDLDDAELIRYQFTD